MKNKMIYGAATAAYQIEGAYAEAGKGPSVWDVFCERRGVIKDGSTGNTACDHYRRFKEDVGLMGELGIDAYRFSVSWPRVLPRGEGEVNEAGLDFYDRLVDELLKNEIDPFMTLYHWDLPYALHLKGGWLNRETSDRFAEYAAVVMRRLGDRVKHVMTFNEPQVFIYAGYVQGTHAPGLKAGLREELAAVHNVLLAHGKAVAAIRACGKDIQTGLAVCGYPYCPATPEDYRTAYEFSCAYDAEHPSASMTIFGDAVILGDYQQGYREKYAAYLDGVIRPGDRKLISAPIDFFGQNCYSGGYVKACADGTAAILPMPTGSVKTTMDWYITPDCVYWLLRYLQDRYHKPLYLTENGIACADRISRDGKIHDPLRVDYVKEYLAEVERARAEGVDIRGYFYWSLLDNFEWSEGYTQRFGLVGVDYATGRRIKKDSFEFYKNYIAKRKGKQ